LQKIKQIPFVNDPSIGKVRIFWIFWDIFKPESKVKLWRFSLNAIVFIL
jgi:hypothetical protein